VTIKELDVRLNEQKKLKTELLRAKLRGEVSQADYVQANADFDAEIQGIAQQIFTLRSQRGTLDAFLGFSKLMLVDISAAWQRAQAEQRLRVQTFLFRDGVAYHQDQKFLNTNNPTLFQQLRALTHPERAVGVPVVLGARCGDGRPRLSSRATLGRSWPTFRAVCERVEAMLSRINHV
jgi:hypothetical protein